MNATDKVNILLVDDKPERLLSYETILAGLGQNLVRARSGIEALEKLMHDEFAVILLDVSMPGMDGFETAGLIHEHPRFENTPIIFVTGVHVTELDRLKGYELGAVDYVYIPVIPQILRSKVAVLVELHCKRKELEQANARLAEANSTLQAEKTRELEQLNRTLQEANRHKDEFLAMLAHELRNPLAPILNAVQIMRREPLPPAQLTWTRDVIERQVRHLTRLVDDLLDVSRITRGNIKVALEPLELSAIIARAIETIQPLITEQRHDLIVSMPDEPLRIRGDLIRLTQAVGNVLANAAKYTDPGGRIELSVTAQETSVEILIRDNGIGIPAESMPQVFELFTQLDRSVHRTRSGLGIGLALVRKLVEMHGGTISAYSEGAGKGSEFSIRLPLMVDPATGAGHPDQAQEAESSVRVSKRILIADDNRDALESLAALLQIRGHEVHVAADGAVAVEVAHQCKPEVALLDIGMPKLDGYEVARQIRSQPWGKDTVLIALTGWGQEDDRRRSREAGFDSHLVKPLDIAALTNILAGLTPVIENR